MVEFGIIYKSRTDDASVMKPSKEELDSMLRQVAFEINHFITSRHYSLEEPRILMMLLNHDLKKHFNSTMLSCDLLNGMICEIRIKERYLIQRILETNGVEKTDDITKYLQSINDSYLIRLKFGKEA